MSQSVAPLRETPLEEKPHAARLPGFDALRASAATIVFLYHYAGFVSALFSQTDAMGWIAGRLGSSGTNLLLLLSGFFLAKGVASGRFSYLRFVALRVARIYIPYLAVLLMALAFAHLATGYSRAEVVNASWTTLMHQLVLLPGVFPEKPVLTVTWTLSYIVAGYLLFPLLGFAMRQRKMSLKERVCIWAAVTGGCFAAGLLWEAWPIRFAYIPAGCLVFETQTRESWQTTWPRMMRKLLAGAALFLLIRALLETKVLGTGWPPLASRGLFTASGMIFASCLVGITLLAQHREGLRRMMPALSLVGGFGRTGYSFYLIHGPVVKLFALIVFPWMAAREAPASSYWLIMPVCWSLAAVAGLVLYRTVERPSRQFLVRGVGGLADGR